MPAEERLAAIESAYSHVEEHAAETSAATSRKKGGGPLDVVAVENYISERFLTRKNGVRGVRGGSHEEEAERSKAGLQPVTDYWVNSLWRSLLKDGHYCSHNDIRAILMSDFSETFHLSARISRGWPRGTG